VTTEAAVLVRAVRTAGRQVPVVLPPSPDPRLHLAAVGMVAAIWVTFAACTGLLAATGHCMTARWHVGQVCGGSFWSVLALPPEILVFMFFMITDPRRRPMAGVPEPCTGRRWPSSRRCSWRRPGRSSPPRSGCWRARSWSAPDRRERREERGPLRAHLRHRLFRWPLRDCRRAGFVAFGASRRTAQTCDSTFSMRTPTGARAVGAVMRTSTSPFRATSVLTPMVPAAP